MIRDPCSLVQSRLSRIGRRRHPSHLPSRPFPPVPLDWPTRSGHRPCRRHLQLLRAYRPHRDPLSVSRAWLSRDAVILARILPLRSRLSRPSYRDRKTDSPPLNRAHLFRRPCGVTEAHPRSHPIRLLRRYQTAAGVRSLRWTGSSLRWKTTMFRPIPDDQRVASRAAVKVRRLQRVRMSA